MAKSDLSAEVVRELLDYDAETGVFRWKKRMSHKAQAGDVAGFNRLRMCIVTLKRRMWLAHRLAWLHYYGAWPVGVIDHINRNPLDNRIANLRDVSQAENMQNRRVGCNNKSGVNGVYWSAAKACWVAGIKVDRKSLFLGNFKALEDAAEARAKAEARFFSPVVHVAPCASQKPMHNPNN